QNHVAKSLLNQQVQRQLIAGGFRKPQAFGLATKAETEIGKSPKDLGQPITVVAERQNRVTVRLTDGIPVAATLIRAFLISIENPLVSAEMVFGEPRKQRWSKVKADIGIIINGLLR